VSVWFKSNKKISFRPSVSLVEIVIRDLLVIADAFQFLARIADALPDLVRFCAHIRHNSLSRPIYRVSRGFEQTL
jgi:hypothetical protein